METPTQPTKKRHINHLFTMNYTACRGLAHLSGFSPVFPTFHSVENSNLKILI